MRDLSSSPKPLEPQGILTGRDIPLTLRRDTEIRQREEMVIRG